MTVQPAEKDVSPVVGDEGVPAHDPLRELYASFTARLAAEPEMGLDGMRDLFERWHLGAAEPPDVAYLEAVDAPVPATWCLPRGARDDRAVVYTHGGGLVVGSRHSHRKLAGHLATHAATPVLVIDFRRAPEDPYPAQVDDAVATGRWLMDTTGLTPGELAFAGDSAGGNVAVGAALRLASEGLAPAGVVAMSPWFDLSNTGGSLEENAAYDAMVDRPTLEVMAGLILGGRSAVDPGANPLHADLSDLPPTFVTTSAHETLRDDAVRFAARAELTGRDITLEVEPHAQHVFQMAAGRAAQADASLARIGAWLQHRLGG